MTDLKALVHKTLTSPAPKYDPRFSVAMSLEQYEAYRCNTGCNYYIFLYNLIRVLQPKKILELGTSIGRSGLFMMCALPQDSKFVTIDIGSHRRGDLTPFDNDERLTILYGSDLEPEVIQKAGDGFDMLFIDSEHTYDQVSKEMEIYQHKLMPGAIVVMDDIDLDGVKKAWDELPFEKIHLGQNLHFSGFGIFQFR